MIRKNKKAKDCMKWSLLPRLPKPQSLPKLGALATILCL